MIKETELRIGNWVEYDRDPNNNYYGIVGAVGEGVAHVEGIFRILKGLSAIPLTPEILENAGFVKDGDGVYVKSKCLYIVKDVLQIAIGYAPLFNCPCKYLHELQNIIFALTGEELKVNLHVETTN